MYQTNITYKITCNNTSEGKNGSHITSQITCNNTLGMEKKKKKKMKNAGFELGTSNLELEKKVRENHVVYIGQSCPP